MNNKKRKNKVFKVQKITFTNNQPVVENGQVEMDNCQ